ncbi:hypothetical protein [Chiayiivirga flava]|uniref:IPTL-CTERM sorting domain-containing protein n=1 Tax=Chiayiivirga flava TaxID=659595 RepID=A0A7W8G043_9GAMM|nr:hypothetical protein [Chiayiivirga flava]MBB5207323.1 hypothetical protein [Chiayiivirga flava]
MKNVNRLFGKTSLALAIGFAAIGSVSAATISVGDGAGLVGGGGTTPAQIAVTYVGDGVTVGYQATLSYDTANLDVVSQNVDGGICGVNDGAGTITIIDGTPDSSVLGDKVTCNLTFTLDAGVADGDVFTLDLNNALYSDADANPSPGPHTENDGEITVSDAPPDIILAFNPDPNVVFPGGTSGTNTVADIDVTVGSGTVGTGTIDNCVLGGANPGAFQILNGTAVVPPADTIDLQVTLANSALSATLTCDLDDASAATQKVFNLSAPAGTPVPAPEFTSTPAPGSALTCNGAPGSVQNTSVTITNAGDLALTFNCSVSGDPAFSLASGGVGNLAGGASQAVNVECTVPAEDAPAAVGSLDCTTNDPAFSAVDYPLSSVAATAPPPIAQPNVVPASSMWSQLSLIGLLAALGLLVVGIRRK